MNTYLITSTDGRDFIVHFNRVDRAVKYVTETYKNVEVATIRRWF